MARRRVEATSEAAKSVIDAVGNVPAAPAVDPRQIPMFGTQPELKPVERPEPANAYEAGLRENAERATAFAAEMSAKSAAPESSTTFREVEAVVNAPSDRGSRVVNVDALGFPGIQADDRDDLVEVTLGEEMYGKPGSFSSYRVGPFRAQGKVRPGETRVEAMKRLSGDLETVMALARDKARTEFCKHFAVAFEPAKG